MHSAEAIRKQDFADSLPRASIQDLGIILMGAGYEVMGQTRHLFNQILSGLFFSVVIEIFGLCIQLIKT